MLLLFEISVVKELLKWIIVEPFSHGFFFSKVKSSPYHGKILFSPGTPSQ